MAASHHITVRKAFGRTVALGVSEWSVPLGNGRLVHPMNRVTTLRNPQEVKRWARRYPDLAPSDVEAAVKALTNP